MGMFGEGQKPLAQGAGPRGMGGMLAQGIQNIFPGLMPQTSQQYGVGTIAPPTGAAPLIPPPGGAATAYGAPTAGGIPAAMGTTQPVPYVPQPGEAPNGPGITNAMYNIENAGSLGINQQAGVAPGTGPLTVDAAGTPTPQGPAPQEDKPNLWWTSLIDSGGQKPMAGGPGPRGMQQNNVKQMRINPQTGLMEWV